MYQEIVADNLECIFQAIKAALDCEETVSISLNKRGDDYKATLVQTVEPPNS